MFHILHALFAAFLIRFLAVLVFLKRCSVLPVADSSDNSDLEDDIILSLNE